VDKSLSEWGDKVPQTDRDELTQVNDELKEALKEPDADAAKLTAASDKVMAVFQRIGQAMYQQTEASSASTTDDQGETSTPSGEDEVVEGEIVEEGGAS
jgi:molecular chaperone DnaK